jgi:hypothetical protein
MADFEGIADQLRRQRKDLEQSIDETATGETKKLLEKLEELRRRAEETQAAMRENVAQSGKRDR